jgi:hypothetical protein
MNKILRRDILSFVSGAAIGALGEKRNSEQDNTANDNSEIEGEQQLFINLKELIIEFKRKYHQHNEPLEIAILNQVSKLQKNNIHDAISYLRGAIDTLSMVYVNIGHPEESIPPTTTH